MSAEHSRHNLVANLAQQGVGVALTIAVPLIIGVDGYAQVTVVAVLIALIPLADFGLSMVYTRKLPALYATDRLGDIRAWNSTILRFRFLTAGLFGVALALYYGLRYQDALNAMGLFLLVVANIVTSFVIANATVQSDFRWIRDISVTQSLARLSVIPFSRLAGVKGWFLGQLLGTCSALCSPRTRRVLLDAATDRSVIDWTLIKANLAEGIVLSLITTLWVQLAASAKIYAAFVYTDAVIAQYGLLASLYQIVFSLGIAAFVPQTIKVYRLIEQDRAAAVAYAFRLLNLSAPIFMALALALIWLAPPLVNQLFPKYQVPAALYAPLMLSLFNLAVMLTAGSLLIGMGKARPYLALITLAALAYLGFARMLAGSAAAAEAQLLAMSVYSVGLLGLVCSYAGEGTGGRWQTWTAFLPSLMAPALYFFVIR